MGKEKKTAGPARTQGGPGIPRRTLIASAGAAGLLALGGAAKSQKPREDRIRPPGAVPRSEFLARCLRCDRCRSICPTDVIAAGQITDGLLEMRVPVMDFRYGHCTFCGKCVEVCPAGALLPFDKKKEKVGVARLNESCIALRTGGCRICYDVCPYHAIAIDDEKRPVIDAEKCNGCGKCEQACPALVTQAFRGGRRRGIEVVPLGFEEKGNEEN